MPWLPLYVDAADAVVLQMQLNADPEIAFIVANGLGSWIARDTLPKFEDNRYTLWHRPGGSLTLLGANGEPDREIEDPYAGWTERRACRDPRTPFFGSDPVTIWLNLRTQSKLAAGIGLSSFEWVGNHYKLLGRGAHRSTEAWWKRLRRSVTKHAIRIPRVGPPEGELPEIWAFPSALRSIRDGLARDDNP